MATRRKAAGRGKKAGSGGSAKPPKEEELDPKAWMILFGDAMADAAPEQDFERQLSVWFVREIERLEMGHHKDDVQRILYAGVDPRVQTGIQLGLNGFYAVQAFDDALKGAIDAGRLQLHPWVMRTWGALSIQAVRSACLGYWLTVGGGWKDFTERSVSMLVGSLGTRPTS